MDPEKRLLLATVHHLDHAIGEVIAALDASGERENTLILFTSDNGPQGSWPGNAYPDDLHLTDFNQPIPMRGKKIDVWEGGIHVPGFVNWPGKIQPQKVNDQVHVIDWLPTLASLIHRPLGDTLNLDGIDLCPLLFDNDALSTRSLYWIWNSKTNRWALRHGEWKIVKYGTDEPTRPEDWQLFNLENDPKETQDIAASNPTKLEEMHQHFLTQRAKDQPTIQF